MFRAVLLNYAEWLEARQTPYPPRKSIVFEFNKTFFHNKPGAASIARRSLRELLRLGKVLRPMEPQQFR